jgi:ATP-dependent DNA helicase RecG
MVLKMDIRELKKFVSAGESETVEFKKSTGQLRRAAETLCGMLNGTGGRVLVGVTPVGRILVESMGRGRGAVYRLRKTNE